MAIQWFPGHMHKAQKEIKKVMTEIDVVIEVLDARIPFSSSNPMIQKLKGDKPCIKILNKADLADPEIVKDWQVYFEKDATVKTLINALAGRNIAKVGNEPAVTKRQQKINLDNGIVLSDTPGVLWPKLDPESCGYRLAATGAIKDTAMEYESVACFTLDFLSLTYPEALCTRFKLGDVEKLKEFSSSLELLSFIGSKRGCLRAGGIIDIHQAATIVLHELRAGKIGQLCLETPEMMQAELAEFFAKLEAKRLAESEAKEKKNSR